MGNTFNYYWGQNQNEIFLFFDGVSIRDLPTLRDPRVIARILLNLSDKMPPHVLKLFVNRLLATQTAETRLGADMYWQAVKNDYPFEFQLKRLGQKSLILGLVMLSAQKHSISASEFKLFTDIYLNHEKLLLLAQELAVFIDRN